VLIKPSHYDADGYVIQWARSSIPSNSLAAVYALARDAGERQALGPDVALDITAMDETNTRVRIKDVLALFKQHDGFGMVGLVGVQSNQFPRALDIARPLRQAGIPVVIGGFHVSGCITMLPDMQADLQARSTWAAACSPARRKRAASTRCCRTRRTAPCSGSTITWPSCRGSRERRRRSCHRVF
jgi:hypothetical protein